MLFQIKLAGRIIEIQSIYNFTYMMCNRYIVSEQCFLKPDIVIKTYQEEINEEIERMCLIDIGGVAEGTNCSMGYIESNVIYRKIAEEMLRYNTILMHGSVVATGGYGYMFTAAKGVGKSTRTRLWIENISNSKVVNGDKPLIKVASNSVDVFGTPWGGKEGWNNNMSVPLRAIFLLERVNEGEKSSMEELSIGNAFSLLIKQTYLIGNTESVIRTLQLIKLFENRVKIYRFRSAPTDEAVRLAYESAKPI